MRKSLNEISTRTHRYFISQHNLFKPIRFFSSNTLPEPELSRQKETSDSIDSLLEARDTYLRDEGELYNATSRIMDTAKSLEKQSEYGMAIQYYQMMVLTSAKYDIESHSMRQRNMIGEAHYRLAKMLWAGSLDDAFDAIKLMNSASKIAPDNENIQYFKLKIQSEGASWVDSEASNIKKAQ